MRPISLKVAARIVLLHVGEVRLLISLFQFYAFARDKYGRNYDSVVGRKFSFMRRYYQSFSACLRKSSTTIERRFLCEYGSKIARRAAAAFKINAPFFLLIHFTPSTSARLTNNKKRPVCTPHDFTYKELCSACYVRI